MYYELFNDVFENNENKICIFERGAFYVIINEQAVYINELLGLNMNRDANYTYKLKGFKKKYEYVDQRFAFNKQTREILRFHFKCTISE